jgi:hypothetical protein
MLILKFAEDFADLVFDPIRTGGALAEALQPGKQRPVHIIDQVVAGQGVVLIERSVRLLRGRPSRPSVRVVDDEAIGLADKLDLHRPALFQVVQICQEQDPGGLLSIVEFGRATGLLPQNVVDAFERLLEQCAPGRQTP